MSAVHSRPFTAGALDLRVCALACCLAQMSVDMVHVHCSEVSWPCSHAQHACCAGALDLQVCALGRDNAQMSADVMHFFVERTEAEHSVPFVQARWTCECAPLSVTTPR